MKELIIFGALALFALLLIILCISFSGSGSEDDADTSEAMTYIPGTYTSSVSLNGSAVEVQVTVDKDHINSIELIHLDESVETMYPLVEPALEELSAQILATQSLEGITYQSESQYTSTLLYNAIVTAIKKASPE
jgi:uncharacterized protein with FMN-binding domain